MHVKEDHFDLKTHRYFQTKWFICAVLFLLMPSIFLGESVDGLIWIM